MKRINILMLFALLCVNVFSQNFHIFKGPTNSTGTMIVLLKEQGTSAYYYPITSTDYYNDMNGMSKSDWENLMRDEKPNASFLQRSANNTYSGKYVDGVTWNLKFSFDEYDKTAKLTLSHPQYQTNSFNLCEVGLDGYQLKKVARTNTSSGNNANRSANNKKNCWVCHGSGMLGYGIMCSTCGGRGSVTFTISEGSPVTTAPVISNTPVSTENGGNTTSRETKPSKRWRNVTKTEKCSWCLGSGKCKWCNGKGWDYGIRAGSVVDCPNCDGYKTGKCSHCHGAGTIQKIEQVFE